MHGRNDPPPPGLLDGYQATTKREVAGGELPPMQIMRERHPLIDVQDTASLVDCGRVITGGGVTLGIDATLHLLARLLGEDVANETARIMEYSRAWRANRDPAGHRAVTRQVRTRTKDGLIGDHSQGAASGPRHNA